MERLSTPCGVSYIVQCLHKNVCTATLCKGGYRPPVCHNTRVFRSCDVSTLTIAMQQQTREVLATDTEYRLLSFQVRTLENGTAMKAGTARTQSISCQVVIPSILTTRGNMASCDTAPIRAAARNTCESDGDDADEGSLRMKTIGHFKTTNFRHFDPCFEVLLYLRYGLGISVDFTE